MSLDFSFYFYHIYTLLARPLGIVMLGIKQLVFLTGYCFNQKISKNLVVYQILVGEANWTVLVQIFWRTIYNIFSNISLEFEANSEHFWVREMISKFVFIIKSKFVTIFVFLSMIMTSSNYSFIFVKVKSFENKFTKLFKFV